MAGNSVEISRQECWSGLPFPFPRDRPEPRIKPASPASPVLLVDSLLLNKEAYILGKPKFFPCLLIYSKLSTVKYALQIKFCLWNQ